MAANQQKSRFFAGDSDSESAASVASEAHDAAGGGGKGGKAAARSNRFQVSESEPESEDEGRVVRSEKEKKFDALLTIVTAIRNQLRTSNWVEVQDGAWA